MLPQFGKEQIGLSGNFAPKLENESRRWDWRQAEIYRDALLKGFQYIADHRKELVSPHHDELAKGTGFCLHLVERHYVVFEVQSNGSSSVCFTKR